MIYFRPLVPGFVLAFAMAAASPAMAQMSGGGMGGLGSSPGAGPAPQPQARTPDIAPPALPGAGTPTPMATGPIMQKPPTGDPTANLFAAVTKGDATAAQLAISAGANLNAQNQFGETPLDLSIALNRNSITFLLLQTRNELDAQGIGPQPMGEPWLLNDTNAPTKTGTKTGSKSKQKSVATPVSAPAAPKPATRVTLPTDSGTPNPQAGFLGFGPKN
jgi:hypothetical protein